jgi:hypothetical protein
MILNFFTMKNLKLMEKLKEESTTEWGLQLSGGALAQHVLKFWVPSQVREKNHKHDAQPSANSPAVNFCRIYFVFKRT